MFRRAFSEGLLPERRLKKTGNFPRKTKNFSRPTPGVGLGVVTLGYDDGAGSGRKGQDKPCSHD
jgi:hypothetical protein